MACCGATDIAGSLFSLCRGETPGRRDATEITLFKSVGSALEDLAAAGLAYAGRRRMGKLDGKVAIVTGRRADWGAPTRGASPGWAPRSRS